MVDGEAGLVAMGISLLDLELDLERACLEQRGSDSGTRKLEVPRRKRAGGGQLERNTLRSVHFRNPAVRGIARSQGSYDMKGRKGRM